MSINAPVYIDQNGVAFINMYVETDDGTFRRTQDEPLRLLRESIKGISRAQGELITGIYDREERQWATPTVTFHYGRPQSFYHFIRSMVAKNKFYVFSKPQMSGRLSKFDLHILELKPSTSQRHISLLKEKYIDALDVWSEEQYEAQATPAQQGYNDVQLPGQTSEHMVLDVDFSLMSPNVKQTQAIIAPKVPITPFLLDDSPLDIEVNSNIRRMGKMGRLQNGKNDTHFPNKNTDDDSKSLDRFIFTID